MPCDEPMVWGIPYRSSPSTRFPRLARWKHADDLEPVVSAGDGPALVGHAAITALFEGFTGAFEKARQVPRFIRADGDLAYEVSNSYLTPKGGGEDVEYRYVATWRRCDDTWRVDSDFFAPGPLV